MEYSETKALLYALEGDRDGLAAYLRDDFLRGELVSLAEAAELVADEARAVVREMG